MPHEVEWPQAFPFNKEDRTYELGSDRRKLEGVPRQGQVGLGKLTDDDLDVIDGRRDQLEGRLQAQYGYAKDRARSEVDHWLRQL